MIPALRGSVTEFAGQRVDELAELPEGAWVLRGDRGLTYSPALPHGSELVAGQWWAAGYKGPPLVSVDQEVATPLGLQLGAPLAVNGLGVEVQAKVASRSEERRVGKDCVSPLSSWWSPHDSKQN